MFNVQIKVMLSSEILLALFQFSFFSLFKKVSSTSLKLVVRRTSVETVWRRRVARYEPHLFYVEFHVDRTGVYLSIVIIVWLWSPHCVDSVYNIFCDAREVSIRLLHFLTGQHSTQIRYKNLLYYYLHFVEARKRNILK